MSTTAVVPDVNSVYIVTIVKDKDVTLTDFFKFVKGEKSEAIHTLVFSKILTKNLVGSDGKEVDLSLGSLVHVESIRMKSAIGFHIANVGPADERGRIQYQFALEKLGLTQEKFIDSLTFEIEGKFTIK